MITIDYKELWKSLKGTLVGSIAITDTLNTKGAKIEGDALRRILKVMNEREANATMQAVKANKTENK